MRLERLLPLLHWSLVRSFQLTLGWGGRWFSVSPAPCTAGPGHASRRDTSQMGRQEESQNHGIKDVSGTFLRNVNLQSTYKIHLGLYLSLFLLALSAEVLLRFSSGALSVLEGRCHFWACSLTLLVPITLTLLKNNKTLLFLPLYFYYSCVSFLTPMKETNLQSSDYMACTGFFGSCSFLIFLYIVLF